MCYDLAETTDVRLMDDNEEIGDETDVSLDEETGSETDVSLHTYCNHQDDASVTQQIWRFSNILSFLFLFLSVGIVC